MNLNSAVTTSVGNTTKGLYQQGRPYEEYIKLLVSYTPSPVALQSISVSFWRNDLSLQLIIRMFLARVSTLYPVVQAVSEH